jgi:prepilin-type N-terminal cleavage/methylation domain-containing protein
MPTNPWGRRSVFVVCRSGKWPASQRGVTLIELMIAITLVAAISAGLLIAMRTSLLTYEKINQRLQDDRRTMGLQQALARQIGGVMPVMGMCGASAGSAGRVAIFNGDPQSVRFVSSDSLAEGARGYPRLVEYQVAPDPNGGVRLLMNERIYYGPAISGPLCLNRIFLPIEITSQSVEMAGKLAYCRLAYREPVPYSPAGGAWLPVWNQPNLPRVVRIEMASLDPAPARLPVLTLNVPVHVTRQVDAPYADQ